MWTESEPDIAELANRRNHVLARVGVAEGIESVCVIGFHTHQLVGEYANPKRHLFTVTSITTE